MHSSLAPWLTVERFEYARLEDHSALVHLLANLEGQLGAPAGAMLIVENGELRSAHPASGHDACGPRSSALLWRASFEVPLDVVEFPGALFTLAADDRVAVALPAPQAVRVDVRDVGARRLLVGAQIRRHVVAIAAGLAIATASGAVVGVAAAGAAGDHPADPAQTTTTVQSDSTTAPTSTQASATVTDQTSTATTTGPPVATTAPTTTGPPVATTTATTTAPPTTGMTTTPKPPEAAGTSPLANHPSTTPGAGLKSQAKPMRNCKRELRPGNPATPAEPRDCAAPKRRHHGTKALHGHHENGQHSKHSNHHRDHRKPTHRDHSSPRTHQERPTQHHAAHPHKQGSPSDRDIPEPRASVAPMPPAAAAQPVAPTAANPWTDALNPNPFTAGELGQPSSGLALGDQPPLFLIPIYKAAARRYHLPWKILAAINSIETNYGRNLNVSSAGAIGWMQFMPATWRMYGVAADGRGKPNPYDPHDAIFAAARYLAANGARHDLRRAIFAYNHADWYVKAVLLKAQEIAEFPVTSGERARLLPNGLAAAPAAAPLAVKEIIAAGNEIAGKPYVYGAGHGLPLLATASAYDCSSSVEHLLYGARLLPVTDGAGSASLESFGQPGLGRWVTLYANAGHVFMYVAGLRWDTHNAAGPGDGSAGIGWHPFVRSSDGFIARHPAGL